MVQDRATVTMADR